MRWLAVAVTLVLSCAAACCAHAAQINVRSIESQIYFRGIPSRVRFSSLSATSLAQDRDGFLWIGTFEGLNRFDGEINRIYDESDGLVHSSIWSLLVDRNGRVWAGSETGIAVLDSGKNQFVEFVLSYNDVVYRPRVFSFLEDDDGVVWIGTSVGLFSYDGEKLVKFSVDVGVPVGGIRTISRDSEGVLWLGTERAGVVLVDAFGARKLEFPERFEFLNSAYVRDLLVDDTEVWIGTYDQGLARYSKENHLVRTYSSADLGIARVRALLKTNDGSILIGSDNGLHVWKDNVFNSYGDRRQDGLANKIILDLFQDQGGVVWVATYSGLVRFNKQTPVLKFLSLEGLEAEDVVVSFSEHSSGRVAIATYSGIAEWDPKKGTISDMLNANSIADQVTSVLYDGRGSLWVGTFSNGLLEMRDGEILRHYRHLPKVEDSLPGNSITDLMLDSYGQIWISTHRSGIAKLNFETNTFSRFYSKSPNWQGDIYWHGLSEDGDGNIWAATNVGAFALDSITGESNLLRLGNKEGATESWMSIAIAQDELLLGGVRSGLAIYDIVNDDFKSFPGLGSDNRYSAYSVVAGEEGNFWISTSRAAHRLSRQTLRFETYDERHGLRGSEHTAHAGIRLSNGYVLFGGNDGVTVVDPDMPERNEYKPPVVLTSFIVNHKDDLTLKVRQDGQIELDHTEDLIEVSFAALDYTLPSRNLYRYKLEGFDEDWVEGGTNNTAVYTNLDSGDYTLRVMGANSDGVWSDKELSIPVRINPAPWATWWAYLIYLTAIAVIFYRLLSLSNQRIGRDAEERFNKRLQLYVFSLDGTAECVLNANNEGRVLYTNIAIRNVLGRHPSEVLGSSLFDVLFQDEDTAAEIEERVKSQDNYQGEHRYITPDKQQRVIETSISRVRLLEQDDVAFAAVVRDVTERSEKEEEFRRRFDELKHSEESLQLQIREHEEVASLREDKIRQELKESDRMLREVHDHVSDSLQTLMSLLNIQSSRLSDPEVLRMIQDHRLRLNVLTLVHEQLHAANNNHDIDMAKLLDTITVSLYRQLAPIGVNITLTKDLDTIRLPIDAAVTIGLIASELISNALIHGFEGRSFGSGAIEIKFHKVAGECILFVADDGKGLPLGFNLEQSGAVGMEVVSILADQLDGSIKFVGGSGTSFEIRFPHYQIEAVIA